MNLHKTLLAWKEAITTNQPLSVLANIEQDLMSAINEIEDNGLTIILDQNSQLLKEKEKLYNLLYLNLVKLEAGNKYDYQRPMIEGLRSALTDLYYMDFPEHDFRQKD